MKKSYYNTNDTFEQKLKRHLKHDTKEKVETLKHNFDDYDETFSYDDYKLWKESDSQWITPN